MDVQDFGGLNGFSPTLVIVVLYMMWVEQMAFS
jgi:hypothetical protein